MAARRSKRRERSGLRNIRVARDKALLLERILRSGMELTAVNIRIITQAVFEQLARDAAEWDNELLARYLKLAIAGQAIESARAGMQGGGLPKRGTIEPDLLAIADGDGSELEKIKRASVLMFGEPIDVSHGEAPKQAACI